VLPYFLARNPDSLAESRLYQPASLEQAVRRVLRKSIPFIQAALIGTLAAAAVAGVAMLISHS
jgi:hypothetical protein